MSALASALPETLEVLPGDEVVVPVHLRNTGSVVDEFTVRVAGEAEAWATVEPPMIALFPNTETVVNVRIRPPRTSATASGVVPFAIMVSASANPKESFAEEGFLRIAPFHETAAELAPRTSRGRRRGKHELALDNYGNVPVAASVTGSDAENALLFRLAPGTLTAAPGAAALARLEVRACDRLWRGPERMLPFQLQLERPEAEPIVLDGVFVQRPLVPWRLFPIAIVLVGLAIAWALLKPGIESTAEKTTAVKGEQRAQAAAGASAASQKRADEAAKTAATASTAARAAGNKAAAATKSAAGAQQTAAGAQETASAAGTDAAEARAVANQAAKSAQQAAVTSGPIPGVPTATRLTVSCPPTCEDTVTVPKEEKWLLTDVVFGNPMNDRGVVTLERDGKPLLVENLDAFRDLTFRFTAPVLVNAKQKIQLAVACDNAPPAPGADATPCTSGVLVTGFAQAVPKKKKKG